MASYAGNALFTLDPIVQLQYHLCTAPLPHVASLPPYQQSIHHFFIPDHLREELLKRNDCIYKAPSTLDADQSTRHPLMRNVTTNI